MSKVKQRFVPSRANSELIDLVNKHRLDDDISWPKLVETLFIYYLKNGLPKIKRRPARSLRKDEN